MWLVILYLRPTTAASLTCGFKFESYLNRLMDTASVLLAPPSLTALAQPFWPESGKGDVLPLDAE